MYQIILTDPRGIETIRIERVQDLLMLEYSLAFDVRT